MKLTKHEIKECIKRAERLIALGSDVPEPTYGICANLSWYNAEGAAITGEDLGYNIVTKYSDSWGGRGCNNPSFPINNNYSIGKWEGANLEQRQSLLCHIIDCLNAELIAHD